MKKFNLELSKQIHHRDETITLHPSYRDLGELEDRHELSGILFLNDEMIGTGYNIDNVSFSIPESKQKELLGKDYKVTFDIYRNNELIMESYPSWLRCETRLGAEFSAMNLRTRGVDFFGTLIHALALMTPRYTNENTIHPDDNYRLFSWEIGPWYLELNWNVERAGFDFLYSPSNDTDNINCIEVNSTDYASIGVSLFPLLDSPLEEWILHPNFRKAIIEEPIGKDMMHHYVFLMALASANNPINNLPGNLRMLTNLTRRL